MTKEKVILAVVAIIVGLLAASTIFYLYQGTKSLPKELQKTVSLKPVETSKPLVLLTLDEPNDEKISETKVVKVSGKTEPDALVTVLTSSSEDVLTPAKNGDFSTTVTLESGANLIQITAIAKNGDTNTIERTISYSSESF